MTVKRIAFLLAAMIMLMSSCAKKEKQAAVGPDKSDGYQVTFVELGSVNCTPCKMMQPIMDEIEKEYAGKVRVVFYDVRTPQGQPYAMSYGIRVIPTQVFLDGEGREYFRHEGYFPKEELVKILRMKGIK